MKDRLDSWLASNPSVRSPNIDAPMSQFLIFDAYLQDSPNPVFTTGASIEEISETKTKDEFDENIGLLTAVVAELQAKKLAKGKAKAPDVPIAPPRNTRLNPHPVAPPSPPVPSTSTPTPPTTIRPPLPRYKYQSPIEDPAILGEVVDMILMGKLNEIQTKHLLAISPLLRAKIVELLKPQRMDLASVNNLTFDQSVHLVEPNLHGDVIVANHALPLQEVATIVNGQFKEWGVLDDGSSIIVIREDLWKETMLPISPAHAMRME